MYIISPMALWEAIRSVRKQAGMKQREFAEALGCSPMHVSKMERPFEESRGTASEELLRRMAKRFTDSEEDRLLLERQLLLERAKLVVPKEVAEHFLTKRQRMDEYTSKEGMPLPFITRLKSDIEEKGGEVDRLFKTLVTTDKTAVEETVQGRHVLSRKSVIELAHKLDQPIEEYLSMSDYMPEEIKSLLKHTGMTAMFRYLSELDAEDVEEMVGIISHILRLYGKKKHRANERKKRQGANTVLDKALYED